MSDHIQRWVTHMQAEGRARRTVQDRAATMRRFERDAGVSLLDATTGDLAEWLGRPDRANVTKSVFHSHLKQFYVWATANGYRVDNPVDRIRAARRPRAHPRPIAPDQYAHLLDAAHDDPDMLAMLLLAGLAGLRVAEIARFDARCLDLAARTLCVRGKGGSAYVLPAHPRIVEHAARMPRSGYWFPSQRARHRGGREVSVRLRLFMLRNGVNATPHQLRHTYATRLVAGGADLRVVQELMRHATLSTTAIYTQISDERKRVAIDRL